MRQVLRGLDVVWLRATASTLQHRLTGKLLIACGEIDENATVDHSLALADALMKQGKRFDLKIWPGLNHYQQTPYTQMAHWDHFVQHLLGQEPPQEYVPR